MIIHLHLHLHMQFGIEPALAGFGEIPLIFQVQMRRQFEFVGIPHAASYKAESVVPHRVLFLGINPYYNMRV